MDVEEIKLKFLFCCLAAVSAGFYVQANDQEPEQVQLFLTPSEIYLATELRLSMKIREVNARQEQTEPVEERPKWAYEETFPVECIVNSPRYTFDEVDIGPCGLVNHPLFTW